MRTMYGKEEKKAKGKSGAAPQVLTSRQCGIMVVSDGSYRPSTSCALTCRLGLHKRPSSCQQHLLLQTLCPCRCQKVLVLCVLAMQMEIEVGVRLRLTMMPSSWTFPGLVA